MRYAFQLAKLVGYTPDLHKRPGIIKQIVESTNLDRHQVSALLKNEVKYVPLHVLPPLCNYLVENGYASRESLPGALFGVEPEQFWEMFTRREHIMVCIAVRQDERYADSAWVVAHDSVLQGEFLSRVGKEEQLAATRPRQDGSSPAGERREAPAGERREAHNPYIHEELVWSPWRKPASSPADGPPVSGSEEFVESAQGLLDEFNRMHKSKALVAIGSPKGNPLSELMLAETFNCRPFESQDDVEWASERKCPIFFRFRRADSTHESCCCGMRLSRREPCDVPGIYYEKKDGTWDVCPWDDNEHDAAVVFYVQREQMAQVQMFLGGFTARSSRDLSRALGDPNHTFWPPFEAHGLRIGLFLVKFTLDPKSARNRNPLKHQRPKSVEIIHIDDNVLRRRLTAPPDDN